MNTNQTGLRDRDLTTPDEFYGQLDNIIMWVFELGFNAARREYGEQYKSAAEAEPHFEDNMDSYIQDIITSHEEVVQSELQKIVEELEKMKKESPDFENDRHHFKNALYAERDLVLEQNEAISQAQQIIQKRIGGSDG